uniref:Uncharacterized protein n=1 Tax=Knipowitschia caucasica TaxID=637954 RepID=A0AAV2LRI4_KNICA
MSTLIKGTGPSALRMLSWVVKVVPQPPELPSSQEGKETSSRPVTAEKKVTFKDEAVPTADKNHDTAAAEGSRPGTAVLSWLSGAIPQPVNANHSAKKEDSPPLSNNPEDDKGMIAWISQGLDKVVPHPELKSKESPPEKLAVRPATAPAAPVSVEVRTSPEEKSENHNHSMMEWLKSGIVKVVPQPEHLKNSKNENPPAPKVEAPPPQPPPAAEEAPSAEQTNVVGWIVNGFGKMLPQPVLKAENGDSAQNHGVNNSHTKHDLVLEDLEQNDGKQEPKKKYEDAEAKTQPLDSVKDDVKTEKAVEQKVDRPPVDGLAAARAAEELAMRAAQEAVRQLEQEQAAKIVLDSIPDTTEHLPNIQEEENEEDPELQKLKEDSDEDLTKEQKAVHQTGIKSSLVDVCPADGAVEQTDKVEPAPDKTVAPEKDPTPITEQKEESKPITQQPQTAEAPPTCTEAPPTCADTVLTGATEESGCGSPTICSPLQTFMLRFPLAAQYLESCKKMMHDQYLSPPSLSLPAPPAELALLAQEIADLPKQAQQYCLSLVSRIRQFNPCYQAEENHTEANEQSQPETSTQPTQK